jgi:1,4-dihydroxy-2-naphthoate polyprenyltransferase
VTSPAGNRWVLGARPRTLPAAIVPVLVGTAAAAGEAEVVPWRAAAAMVVALAIQVGTNYANDYSDGVRGTDEQRVGPVRLVASGLAPAGAVKRAALASYGVAAVAGLALAVVVGPELLVVGAVSFAAGWLYTGGPRPYGYAGAGEVFVFVFFGVVATVGSTYVHTGRVTALSLLASIPVGFLATALLVVNNLRDREGDARVGKRTLAVLVGDGPTRLFYELLVLGSFLATLAVAAGRGWAVVALAAFPLAVRPLRRVMAGAGPGELIGVLGDTGRLQLVFGLLLAAGMAVSA